MKKPNLKKLLELVHKFKNARTLVVGDVILDQYIWGKVRRISPEAPVPVVEVEEMTFRLGGAANVAAGVVALGGAVGLVGVIGEDLYGAETVRLLEKLNVSTHGLIRERGRPTTLKTRVMAHSQQIVRYDRETRETLDDALESKILKWTRSNLDELDAIILSDYDKGVLRGGVGQGVIKSASAKKVVVTADPKVPNIANFRGADVVTPNQSEAERITGVEIITTKCLDKAGKTFLDKYVPKALLITRGESGMSLFRKGEETVNAPAMARQVFDVTGAGDTVIAAFTLALAVGANHVEAMWISNAAAAVTVGKVGTVAVTQDELIASLRQELSR